MKRILMFSVVLAALTISATRLVIKAQSSHAVYTASLIATSYDPFSKQATFSQARVVAQRSDGSTVESRVMREPDGKTISSSRQVMDFSTGLKFVVDDGTQSITTYKIPDQSIQQVRQTHGCDAIDLSGQQRRILGLSAVKVPTVHKATTMTINEERWVVPALDCLPVIDNTSDEYGVLRESKMLLRSRRETRTQVYSFRPLIIRNVPRGKYFVN